MLTAYIRTVSDSYSRPTTRNTDTFGYNDLGEVVFSRRGAEGAEDAYAYDSIGNQTNFVANATTNPYTHNSLNQLETATIPQFYILNSPFSISNDLSGTLQGAGGVGGLLAVSINTNFYFPAYDNNGNITHHIAVGPLADFLRHRFSTKYYDPEIGLYYYGYRFYSPTHMRWLNRDPIEEEGGLNIYSFCLNTPVVQIDILGDTTIGQILDAFFAKENTSPKLWVMGGKRFVHHNS